MAMTRASSTPAHRLTLPVQRWRTRHGTAAPGLPRGIRVRRSRDVGSCARLLRRAYFEGVFPGHGDEDPRSWLDAPEVNAAWVAEQGGEIVGHVAVSSLRVGAAGLRWREIVGRPTEELRAVSRLFVRPRSRGAGIGSTLLQVATADVRARGLVPVTEVLTLSSEAPAFYLDQGWRLRASDMRRDPRTSQPLWLHQFEGPPPR
jgi:GNAT superfamily N-acetyltransferase